MPNIYMQTNKNRSYLTEDVVPFKGEVVAYRKQQNDLIEQRYLYIYKITCLKDNRVYIGKRIAPVDCEDPLLDKYKGSGYVIKALKEKYDWYQDFKFEIVQFCENEDTLNKAEKYHIAQTRKQYGDLCCNIDDGGAGLSPAKAKRLWEDPEYRQARSEQKTELNLRMWQDPYYREMWSQMTKERMSKPEFREMSRQIMSQNWEDPEWREAQRQRSIQRWQNPEYRAKMSELASKNIKKYWEEHPERKEAFREETKKRWENPEYRQKQIEKMTKQSAAYWSDPKHREEASRKAKLAWQRRKQKMNGQNNMITNPSRCKRIRVQKTFTSPKNGRYFEEGTIFNSVFECAAAIGVSVSNLTRQIMHNKSHPGTWCAIVNHKMTIVSSFEFVDDEE